MNIEKIFYSLIGCIVASVIIQNSYNLEFPYMIGATIILWVGCLAVHAISEKRIKDKSIQLEERNNEFIQQTVDKLITTITTESKSTNKVYEDVMTSVRDRFEKTCSQIEQMSREEKESIITCVNRLTDSVSAEIVNIHEDISKTNETLKYVLNVEREFSSQVNSIEKSIVDRNDVMTQVLADFRAATEEIKELKSISSNIQNGAEDIRSMLGSVQACSDEANGKIDDLRRVISDAKEDMERVLTVISDNLQGNMDKQLEIVEQYDVLLGKVNDEILVKIINDSNNVVQLLKDCYTMLEINRKARR